MPLITQEKIHVHDPELVEELEEKGYGEKRDDAITLSQEETLYLKEKRREFPVENEEGKKLTVKQLKALFTQQDEEFPRKYPVYKDLRDRGFCVRTGFKFGSDYRVYKRGEKPGTGHAIWLVQSIQEEHTFKLPELSRAIRLAQNVRKKMIYAVVDKEGDITYYKVDRITP